MENKEIRFTSQQTNDKTTFLVSGSRPFTPIGKIYQFIRRCATVMFLITAILHGALFLKLNDLFYLFFSASFFILTIFNLFFQRIRGKLRYKKARELMGADSWTVKLDFGEKVSINTEKMALTYDYTDFGRLTEDKDCFHLWLDRGLAQSIPKNSFIFGDPADFTAYIKPRLGTLKKGNYVWGIVIRLIYILGMFHFLFGTALSSLAQDKENFYQTQVSARNAYYGLRTDNKTPVGQIDTEDSSVIFYSDKTQDYIYVMLFEKKDQSFRAVTEYKFDVSPWADSNSGRPLSDLIYHEDGLLQISRESREQVLFACLPGNFNIPASIRTSEENEIYPFTCKSGNYIVFALVGKMY